MIAATLSTTPANLGVILRHPETFRDKKQEQTTGRLSIRLLSGCQAHKYWAKQQASTGQSSKPTY
jgi:hypothetical protein